MSAARPTSAAEPWRDPEPVTFGIAELGLRLTPRLKAPDRQRVMELAEVFEELPPILVERETLDIVDGVHRREAAKLREETTIVGNYFRGTHEEAVEAAIRLNVEHGTPLTLTERRHAALNLLTSYPDWADRRIAEACGLSNKTVDELRSRPTEEFPQLVSRLGRDGRRRPTDPVQVRQAVAAAIEEDRELGRTRSLRAIADEVGTSVSTASDVLKRLDRGQDPIPAKLRRHKATPGRLTETHGDDLTDDTFGDELAPSPTDGLAIARRLARSIEEHRVDPQDWMRDLQDIPCDDLPTLREGVQALAEAWTEVVAILDRRLHPSPGTGPDAGRWGV